MSVREDTQRASRRWALVTGAGSGIGYATAERLAQDGWNLAIVDLSSEGLDLATEAIEATEADSLARVVDVSDWGQVERTIAELSERLHVDLLVNIAGVGVAGSVCETSREDWDRLLAVNLSGTFALCRAALPGMLEAGAGRIVNVASVAGVVGLRRRAAYCASKGGVIALTRAIAADHAAEGIRANVVCPGTIDTPWVARIVADAPDPDAAREAMAARQLDGRMGSPEEVAGAISYLASDEARFVNGSVFVIDGGLTAV